MKHKRRNNALVYMAGLAFVVPRKYSIVGTVIFGQCENDYTLENNSFHASFCILTYVCTWRKISITKNWYVLPTQYLETFINKLVITFLMDANQCLHRSVWCMTKTSRAPALWHHDRDVSHKNMVLSRATCHVYEIIDMKTKHNRDNKYTNLNRKVQKF